MANYDSDSSDEGTDYTTTNVVLGYAVSESGGDDISHIGGHPVWLDPKSTPPASLARCKVCNDYMSLLLQLNADLQQHFPNDSRRLQVWTCRKKACTRKPGSIAAFREVKKGKGKSNRTPTSREDATKSQGPVAGLGNGLFGGSTSSSSGNANPFSTNTGLSTGTINPFSSSSSTSATSVVQSSQEPSLPKSFAGKLKIDNESAPRPKQLEPWPKDEEFPSPYPFFYLDAYPEELDPTPEQTGDALAGSSKGSYDIDDSTSSGMDKDTFESSLDKAFQKFSDLVAQNPEQVLRYEFKGQPVLYSGTDGVASRFVVPHGKAGAVKGVPRCEKCGSQRVFEMQLTPYLIFEIEKNEAIDIDNGMEWGTIIVSTCLNNCGDEDSISFREEWVGVQWEERVARK